jgi:formylmethanofuran dehydrogenase subunit E
MKVFSFALLSFLADHVFFIIFSESAYNIAATAVQRHPYVVFNRQLSVQRAMMPYMCTDISAKIKGERSMLPEKVIYSPIGRVENDFAKWDDPKKVRNSESVLAMDERFIPAIEGLERFRYIIIIYHMDRTSGYEEKVHPMGDSRLPKRGVLSTRSPCRPNLLGMTVVEVLEVDGRRIKVTGLDALDGTPIIDIKPYEEHFDSPNGVKWERDPGYMPEDMPSNSKA